MSGLSVAAGDYLTVRRALGYELVDTSRLLAQFTGFADSAGATVITTELALRWATLPSAGSAIWHGRRLGVVR